MLVSARAITLVENWVAGGGGSERTIIHYHYLLLLLLFTNLPADNADLKSCRKVVRHVCGLSPWLGVVIYVNLLHTICIVCQFPMCCLARAPLLVRLLTCLLLQDNLLV